MKVSFTIRQVFAFLTLAMLVAITLYMAWPRMLSSLQFLPVQQAQAQLFDAKTFQKLDVAALQSKAERAISYHDAYSYHSFLSLVAYVKASDVNVSLYSKQHLLSESVAEAKLALGGAPLQPDLWLRMAQAGAQIFVPAPQLVEYFRMAIWSGRVEPTHLISRLHIGFALMHQLDTEALNLLRDQVLLAWNLKQADLRRAIQNKQLNYKRMIELMSVTHPDVVREMEKVFGPITF